jgi:hypothetical protein
MKTKVLGSKGSIEIDVRRAQGVVPVTKTTGRDSRGQVNFTRQKNGG